MIKEFREFINKGNALDLAVGVIIGTAFGQVVNSLVQDVFNPVLGLLVGRVDLDNIEIPLPGQGEIEIGSFISVLINFLIVAFAIFLIIKQFNRFRKPVPVKNSVCPFCKMDVSIEATKCPHCTSSLENK